MYYQKSVQGCISRHSDNAIWQDANITLAIKNTRNNGFYDLVATADITIDSNGASIDNVPIDATQHVFRYNGEFYQADRNAPWWLGNY